MKIEQKKNGTKIEYELEKEFLHYKMNDENGSHSVTVPYEDISNDISEFGEKNQWYKNVGLIWLFIGLVDLMMSGTLSMWLVLGILFYGFYLFYQTSYSKINATNYNLLIIKNKNHDELMGEIFKHRNDYLRTKYGMIDTKNDKKNELNKYKFLKNLGVISEKEYDEFEKTIEKEMSEVRQQSQIPQSTSMSTEQSQPSKSLPEPTN